MLSELGSVSDTHRHDTLGIASEIYVVSLPNRADRRATMERLRLALGLRWTYVSATRFDNPVVTNIMNHVRAGTAQDGRFTWPDDIDLLSRSRVPLGFSDSDIWATSAPAGNTLLTASLHFENLDLTLPDDSFAPALAPLTCATRDFASGAPYTPSLPAYMLLTPAKVACWYSHLEVIRHIADGGRGHRGRGWPGVRERDDVAVVLEDDIDMEHDIAARLSGIWGSLPDEWDIVFLGHCWSNESQHAPLAHGGGTAAMATALYPSFAPKCTHAYALTRTGARRLLLHLRHAPFAYSRALDQALAWLVVSGRLRAFSVVPSVVVQRKVAGSDIEPGEGGMGSGWREQLEHGVFSL
ncbi:hypothetical protein B0H21DRAFT_692117 [Amylocystis lapponica]|nr:hypothetical protein B0H21DRAFT_692117 [Amylocystis lapponica]